MNCRGFLAGFLAARSGQCFLERLLHHPPGWPVLEALFIAALILLASVAVDLIANLAGCTDGQ
jgi:hypothetical protein